MRENGIAEHGEHLLLFLESENQRTVKVTLEALSRLMQEQGVQIQKITKTQYKHIKKYLILLLARERTWYRLPYLIYLYDLEEDVLRQKIRAAINCRNLYERISAHQAQQIRQAIIEQKGALPQHLVKSLLLDLKYVEL